MADSREIEELKEQLQILQHENELLSARSEDTLMLGLVSEAIEQADDVSDMLDIALERISMLKDLPFVACCSMAGNVATVIQSYMSFCHADINTHQFELPALGQDTVAMHKGHPLMHFMTGTNIDFLPDHMLLIPFSTHEIPHGVYLFAELGAIDSRLGSVTPILQRITDILTISMDNRGLLSSYKALNAELDQRVERRSKALIESEHKYRALIEGSDAAIMLFSDEHFEDCNDATLRMFQCESKELFLNLNPAMISAVVQPDGMDSMSQAKQFVALAMQKGAHCFDWIHRRLNGEEFPADVHLSRVSVNNVDMIQGVVIDISDRVKAEQALRQSEEKYRNIIENMQDCLYKTDIEGRLLFSSPSIQRLMRCEQDEILGDRLSDYYVDPNGRQKFLDLLLASPTGSIECFEAQVRRKDGELIWVSANSHLVYDKQGQMQGVEGTLRDITELRQMEENFNQAQKMEAIGTLVGGIAHDFNNVLAAMLGSMYLLKMKLKDQPKLISNVESMEKQSFRAANMIKQLLAFARKGRVEMQLLSFTSLMKEVFKLSKLSIPENIFVHISACSDQLQVKADPSLLQQILMNLMNNARDAVADRTTPEILVEVAAFRADAAFVLQYPEAELSQSYARLIVRDNGCGISETTQAQVFEPFYTTKDIDKGTGLGLAMVYGALQSHAGMIEIDSVVDEGCSFTVYLPLSTEAEDLNKAIDGKLTLGAGESILFVDDQPEVRAVNVKLLQNLGYQLFEAQNGEAALKIYAEHQQDIKLVITDIVMPQMGGLALAENIWSEQPSMPVIFISAYDKEDLSVSSTHAEQSVVLQKPFSFDQLSQHIRELLSVIV